MTDPSTRLEIVGLSVHYRARRRDVVALDNVSFSLQAGQTLALVGESGSGKSTLAAAVIGNLDDEARVTHGSVRMAGREMIGLRARHAGLIATGHREFGYVPQDPTVSLNPTRTVGSQIIEVARRFGLAHRKNGQAVAEEVLGDVGIRDPRRAAALYPHQISGGMRQRALIGIALLGGPPLLVADEPSSGLDTEMQERILTLLTARVRDVGASLLLITHDLAVAAERADSIAVLRRGELVEFGPAADVLQRPRHPYSAELMAARPRRLRPLSAATDAAARSPVVVFDARGLTKRFATPGGGEHAALDDISVQLHRGRTLGVIGQSGSGKTTLARIIYGLEPFTSGRVVFDGTPVNGNRIPRDLLRRVRMVSQNPFNSLNPALRIGSIIADSVRAARFTERPDLVATARAALDAVRLDPEIAGRRPRELSGGQRQRVAIARALATRPDMLILDEPVSALDASVQADVLALLQELQLERDLTYLFISHDLAAIHAMSDDVLTLEHGRVVAR